MDNTSSEDDPILKDAMYNSGFQPIHLDVLYEVLEKMEEYLIYHTGLNKQELSEGLIKLQELIGEEQALKLEIDEIVKWLKAF
jgi:hypothetical protein